MLARFFIFILSFIASYPLWAITCYFTFAKDNCWTKYDVTVEVMDKKANILTTVNVPKGESWTRKTFPCNAAEKLMYRAWFLPNIWESDKGKTYSAKRFWSLPEVVKPGDSAWNVSVCYPRDFSQVPLPPEASNNCQCDFDSIPTIPPKKI